MKKRAFIVHGWEGNPNIHWLPWLKKSFEEKGFVVSAEQMPNPILPKMDQWVESLAKQVVKPDENCYLIGHSLGGITILRYLETLKEKEQVGGVIMVAGFSDDLKYKELSNFFSKPIEWNKINSHCKNFVAIFSDNDPLVSVKYAEIFKNKLGAQTIMEHGKGHFNDEDGIRELPSVLNSVLKLSENKKNQH